MSRVLNLKNIPGKPALISRRCPSPSPAGVRSSCASPPPLSTTAALNHRDLFIRHNLYPGIEHEKPLLADGSGTVVEVGPGVSNLLGEKVILTPMRGWESDPDGPEKFVATTGST
ncbi:unnamed protein product, partial [Clonostachys rosea]